MNRLEELKLKIKTWEGHVNLARKRLYKGIDKLEKEQENIVPLSKSLERKEEELELYKKELETYLKKENREL